MQCNLYATFRLLAGIKTFNFDLPEGATIREAIQAVVAERPVLRPHWLDESGSLHAHVHVIVNGQDMQNLPDGIATRLAAGDVLDFFPPVGGGAA